MGYEARGTETSRISLPRKHTLQYDRTGLYGMGNLPSKYFEVNHPPTSSLNSLQNHLPRSMRDRFGLTPANGPPDTPVVDTYAANTPSGLRPPACTPSIPHQYPRTEVQLVTKSLLDRLHIQSKISQVELSYDTQYRNANPRH